MKYIVVYTFLALFIVACSNNINKDVYYLNEVVKHRAIPLIGGDTIKVTGENYKASTQHVYNDSVLIVRNSRRIGTGEGFLELRKLSDNTLIKELFPKGNGPGEFLSFQLQYMNGETICVMDAVKRVRVFINVDSLINSKEYKIKQYKTEIENNLFGPWMINGKLFYQNSYVYQNPSIGIDVNGKRFISHEEVGTYLSYKHEYAYNTFNVSQGAVITNSSDRILFFPSQQTFYEVYDSNLNLLKRVEGFDDLDSQKFLFEGDENNLTIVFNRTYPSAYESVCCSKKFVYALYEGVITDATSDEQTSSVYIFKFDWDGNLVQSYFLDSYVRTISVSNDDSVLYANVFDDDGMSFVVKYNLEM